MTRAGRTREKSARGAFWALALFYLLAAFEFFYMASPFAVYLYSAYRPGLNLLADHPRLAWLAGLFLPHIVDQTSSRLINLLRPLGALLALAGFLSFCLAAGQVYYAKLARKGAATRGLYRYLRHPQYLSLALSGLGLLLLWPRYLALLIYVTMLLAYYLLARLEERQCLARFGRSYSDYLHRTGMFLPFRVAGRLPRPAWTNSRPFRACLLLAAYLLALGMALGAARSLHLLSAQSLYALYTDDSAFISVIKIEPHVLAELVGTALGDQAVRARLKGGPHTPETRYLNYVLPLGWSVSEIPMRPAGGEGPGHLRGSPSWGALARIVFTRAVLGPGPDARGPGIVLRTVKRVPLAEVTVDLEKGAVVGVEDPVLEGPYGNLPLPVF